MPQLVRRQRGMLLAPADPLPRRGAAPCLAARPGPAGIDINAGNSWVGKLESPMGARLGKVRVAFSCFLFSETAPATKPTGLGQAQIRRVSNGFPLRIYGSADPLRPWATRTPGPPRPARHRSSRRRALAAARAPPGSRLHRSIQ